MSEIHAQIIDGKMTSLSNDGVTTLDISSDFLTLVVLGDTWTTTAVINRHTGECVGVHTKAN